MHPPTSNMGVFYNYSVMPENVNPQEELNLLLSVVGIRSLNVIITVLDNVVYNVV